LCKPDSLHNIFFIFWFFRRVAIYLYRGTIKSVPRNAEAKLLNPRRPPKALSSWRRREEPKSEGRRRSRRNRYLRKRPREETKRRLKTLREMRAKRLTECIHLKVAGCNNLVDSDLEPRAGEMSQPTGKSRGGNRCYTGSCKPSSRYSYRLVRWDVKVRIEPQVEEHIVRRMERHELHGVVDSCSRSVECCDITKARDSWKGTDEGSKSIFGSLERRNPVSRRTYGILLLTLIFSLAIIPCTPT